MAKSKTGGDLFIVDNSISDWTGLEYLKQWTEIARSFDIATGRAHGPSLPVNWLSTSVEKGVYIFYTCTF